MRDLDFVSAAAGWMVAGGTLSSKDFALHGARLYRTADGGRLWRAAPAPRDIRSVCFGDSHRGWIAGGSRVWETADGGARWSPAFRAPVRTLPTWTPSVACAGSSVWVTFTGNEMSLGHEPYVIYRRNGHGWTPVLKEGYSGSLYPTVRAPDGPAVTGEVDVLSPSLAFFDQASYGVGVISRTTDGGRTFDRRGIIVTGANESISFGDAEHGWLAGRGVILATSDGGRIWREQYPSPSPRPAGTIDFVSGSLGYGLGTAGDPDAVLRTQNGGANWRIISELPDGPVLSWRGPARNALSFVSRSRGWAASSRGALWLTTDGGLRWTRQQLPGIATRPGGRVDQIMFADARHGCLLSGGTNTWVTSDGGHTWSEAYCDQARESAARCSSSSRNP